MNKDNPTAGLYLEIADRFKTEVISNGLEYEKYRQLIKVMAKSSNSAVTVSKGKLVIDTSVLNTIISNGYSSIYSNIARDKGFNSIESLIDTVGIDGLIKVDLFFYSLVKDGWYNIYLIADMYPISIGYVPLLQKRNSLKFVDKPVRYIN
jgi:hypothetical protein